jgi:hypothetical protein
VTGPPTANSTWASPHQVANVVAIFALIVVTYRKFRRAAAKRFVVREMLASKKRA